MQVGGREGPSVGHEESGRMRDEGDRAIDGVEEHLRRSSKVSEGQRRSAKGVARV